MRWVIVVLGLGTGCGTTTAAARMADLDLPEPTFRAATFTGKRVLVRRFSDARPREATRSMGGAGVIAPTGYTSEYTMAYAERGARGKVTVYYGSMPSDLPYLLARSLPGDNVSVADELPDAGAGGAWDYVVEGRLLETRNTSWVHLGLAALGVLGTPGRFSRYELSYELSLYAGADPEHPLLTRTYAFDDRVAVGIYYGRKRAERLPREAIESVLAHSARDLITEVEKHEARVASTG
jgi:hypothetical protein